MTHTQRQDFSDEDWICPKCKGELVREYAEYCCDLIHKNDSIYCNSCDYGVAGWEFAGEADPDEPTSCSSCEALNQEVQKLRGLLGIAVQYMPIIEELTLFNYAETLPWVSAEVCAVQAYINAVQISASKNLMQRPTVKVEGYDDSSCAEYTREELIMAGLCYATPPDKRKFLSCTLVFSSRGNTDETVVPDMENIIPPIWPWTAGFWKPTTYQIDLEKAQVLFSAAHMAKK